MSIFNGIRQKLRGGSNPAPVQRRPIGLPPMPPRPNPAAKFAPKPNNPQTVKRGNELGQGYQESKRMYDQHMERATNHPDPKTREHHAKQAEEWKSVMGGIDADIKANAPKGDPWRSKF